MSDRRFDLLPEWTGIVLQWFGFVMLLAVAILFIAAVVIAINGIIQNPCMLI